MAYCQKGDVWEEVQREQELREDRVQATYYEEGLEETLRLGGVYEAQRVDRKEYLVDMDAERVMTAYSIDTGQMLR